jgi:uncharacterized membrane protein YhdT
MADKLAPKKVDWMVVLMVVYLVDWLVAALGQHLAD